MRGWGHAHVRADLGQDHLGGSAVDSWDGPEQLNLSGKRVQHVRDPLIQGGDVRLLRLDVVEHPRQ